MEDFQDIEVRRFAIDKASTSLLIEYKTGKGKRFLRRIRFKRYKADCDPVRVAAKLMRQFTDILGKDKVNEDQVLELVQLLLSKKEVVGKIAAVSTRTKENIAPMETDSNNGNEGNAFGDLNKVSEEENQHAKAIMEQDFQKNATKPGDDGYVYDKQVDFGEASEENDWDLDSFDDDELDEADV